MRPLRLLFLSWILFSSVAWAVKVELLNASYDPTREMYHEYNAAFHAYWKAKTGNDVVVKQSHGGSGKQARSVLDGLRADVVTLALGYDLDILYSKRKLIPQDWQTRLPNRSTPFTSTIVFLVRKGNPKQIRDWSDLVKPGIGVITPNPKTSGGARWNYFAAWGFALRKPGGNESKAEDFVRKLYQNVPVLDAGARGSTTTFVQRGIGDVLITWENEAYLAIKELGKEHFEVIYPPSSILAEPPVTVVDRYANKKGTYAVAKAYLEYLYSPVGQEIAAKHYFRPSLKSVADKFSKQFPAVQLFTLQDISGDWISSHKKHFTDGGVFDRIYGIQ